MNGSPECPCATLAELGSLTPLNVTAVATASVDLTSYGVGCAPHDASRSVCLVKSPAYCDTIFPKPTECTRDTTWCASSWCFIGERCSLLYRQPSLDEAVSSDVDRIGPLALGSRRFYSYATCNATRTPYSGPHITEALRGKTLRVAFRANSGGWMGSYESAAQGAEGTHYGGWHGPAASFFAAVQRRAGFHVNLTTVPSHVLLASGSSSRFTQCVYAAALGYVDLCVGDFSITDSRNQLTPFYVVDNLPLRLIVPSTDGFDASASLSFVFSPFHQHVWGVLLAMLTGFGLILSFQEAI